MHFFRQPSCISSPLRSQYTARSIGFDSSGAAVRIGNSLTEQEWEDPVQGLSKFSSIIESWLRLLERR